MRTKSAIFLGVTAFFLAACNYTPPAATSTVTPIPTASPTAIVSTTPTITSTGVNDLNAELNTTIDDGGQADLNQLQKDSAGL